MIPIVVTNDGHNERSYDIYSRLLKENIIFVDGVVETRMASVITASLLHLEAEDPEKPIYMYINSPGGSVYDGLAVINTMRFVKNTIVTVVTGSAMSMGAMFLSCGTKGHRIALLDSTVMIHQPSSGTQGKITDQFISLKEGERLKHRLTTMMAENTGKDYETVLNDMERDKFLSAHDALEYGIIDKVVSSRSEL